MKNLILLFNLIYSISIPAQISTFAELKAGMMLPQTIDNNTVSVQQGNIYGFELGLNLSESNSVGISINYGKDGNTNRVAMSSLFKGNSNSETSMLEGSSTSLFTVGIITRTANTSLFEFIHPYAKMFLGYSYITLSGINNQDQFAANIKNVTENKFTAIFGLGLLIPISALYGGIGFETDYNIYMSKQESERSLSIKFLYRYNLKFN
jgi:hypothetical protein